MFINNINIIYNYDKISINDRDFKIDAIKRCKLLDRMFSEFSIKEQYKIYSIMLGFYKRVCKLEGFEQHKSQRTMRHRDNKTHYRMYKSLCTEISNKLQEISFDMRCING